VKRTFVAAMVAGLLLVAAPAWGQAAPNPGSPPAGIYTGNPSDILNPVTRPATDAGAASVLAVMAIVFGFGLAMFGLAKLFRSRLLAGIGAASLLITVGMGIIYGARGNILNGSIRLGGVLGPIFEKVFGGGS
jgi:hypothetical protein